MNTIRIFGLATLTLLSLVPMAKPAPPTLTTQFFSQPVTLVAFANSVTSPCPTVIFAPQIFGINFTENLSGRDPGSSWLQIRSDFGSFFAAIPLYLIRQTDLTPQLIQAMLCQGPPSLLNSVQTWVPPTLSTPGEVVLTWRVLASGSYSLVTGFGSSINILPYVNITESWTVTAVS